MRQHPFALFLFASAAALAACGGGNTTLVAPTPGPTCSPPAGMQAALVYPAPNATAIPDSFGQVVLGTSSAFGTPSNWNVVLFTALSPSGVGGGSLHSASPPFPTPNASPSFANPQYYSSSFAGATFPGEVVTVTLNNATTSCTPLAIGQFTTQ